jgi:serine protease
MASLFRSALILTGCGLLLSGCGGGSPNGEELPDLSGTIAIETNTRVDGDTADEIRLGLAEGNDQPANAQTLPANATVGGYLSFGSGTYRNSGGVFDYFTDETDLFTAELVAGDRISLQVFSSPDSRPPEVTAPPTRQVRVLKTGAGGSVEEVLKKSGSGDLNPITIGLPTDFPSGSYLIEVSASAGMPFRYVLSLAGTGSTTVLNARYTEPSFVMDEAVVRMEPQNGPRTMAASLGVTRQQHLGRNLWLMQRNSSGARVLSDHAGQVEQKATMDWVRSLGKQPGVTLAEPNYVYRALAVSPDDDDFYDRQWNLPFMRAPLAWQAAPNNGTGVGIAVMDTGLFRSPPATGGAWHPDLAANVNLISGEIMDYVSGARDIDGSGGRDTNPADPGDGRSQSSNFHGTHVAGIAAAVDNNIGIVGVATQAEIYPVRVLGAEGIGSSADLIDAINWASTRPEIDVINLSLGGLGPSNALKSAIDRAYNGSDGIGGDGQLIVAAAGNAATDEPTYPAAYENVVGVGAVDGDGVLAGYSNIGPSVDLVAPGGDGSRDANLDGLPDVIVSTWGTDLNNEFIPDYTALQGTSMAAPHVAGVYALMKGEAGDLTPEGFFSLLKAGSLTRPVGPAFQYGAGLIDALASMDAALGGTFPVTLASSPTAVEFNAAVLSTELSLSTFPEGEVFMITGVRSSAAWLSASVDNSIQSPETVTVSASTQGLEAQRRYTAELFIDYDPDTGEVGTLMVPVSLQLGSPADEKNAGRHYVLLISSEGENDGEVAAQSVVTADNGRYQFVFDSVEPGQYFLVAGTDTDNNGFICENGEACAEYPVNGLPETISLGDIPKNDVVLNTSFRRPTISALGLPRIGFEGYRLKSDTESSGKEPFREYVR